MKAKATLSTSTSAQSSIKQPPNITTSNSGEINFVGTPTKAVQADIDAWKKLKGRKLYEYLVETGHLRSFNPNTFTARCRCSSEITCGKKKQKDVKSKQAGASKEIGKKSGSRKTSLKKELLGEEATEEVTKVFDAQGWKTHWDSGCSENAEVRRSSSFLSFRSSIAETLFTALLLRFQQEGQGI
jgi:hypothetical protein